MSKFKTCFTESFRVNLFIYVGGAEDLGTRWRGVFHVFMVSRPNFQYSDWMELIIYEGVSGSKQPSLSMQMSV